MRNPFARRVPAALFTAIVVTGCNLSGPGVPPTGGGAKKGPVTLEAKIKKVDAIAKGLSLENNAGLKKASESVQKLVEALAKLTSASATVPASAGAMRYQAQRALSDFADGSAEATYELSGVAQQGQATIVYDDVTHEVTGIVAPDAEIALKFVNNGRKRSWQATIVRSPDGTTGSFFIEVEGGWTSQPGWNAPAALPPPMPCPRPAQVSPRPYATPRPMPTNWNATPRPTVRPATPWPAVSPTPGFSLPPATPSPRPSVLATPTGTPSVVPTPISTPTPWPSPAPSGGVGYRLEQLAAMPDYSQEPPYDDSYDGSCGPMIAYTPPPPPPYKIFGGEYPNVIGSVTVRLDVVPKGDKSLALKFNGTFNEPESFPGQPFQIPTHWDFLAELPGLKLDWESHAHLDPGRSKFDMTAGLVVAGGEDGSDTFKLEGKFDEATKFYSTGLTHVDAKVKLLVEAHADKMVNGKPEKAVVLSTEDNSQIGTIDSDPEKPGVVLIKLDKDQRTIEWRLIPQGFSVFPMSPPVVTPMAPPDLDARMPDAQAEPEPAAAGG